ncbi:hypothetical protein GUITHDRAFT_148199 [Guillardia theta CCMP2712]|uniref:AAA+ ATPase domain-containing protein n=1 Tax=Guillardia theta (strain CCMP2712) TaxID=905079 RepID=L1IAA5_GUITC|nr:hypothetical protein GUITHDRAFT_148199 [Guillardia theta CCMP2712]EKX33042.1 hypothetical protein GUITHDRAFT_148199 [Guillardia theta CCMP2712]|eukprot:XP_005820022.1 hypothetical protein GUITHDRAFT_148199 [Guillardia theta CCMP2712]
MNDHLPSRPSSAFLHKGIISDGSSVVEHDDTRLSGGITSGNDEPKATSSTPPGENSDEIQSESVIKRVSSLKHRASLLHHLSATTVSRSRSPLEVPDANVPVRPCSSPPTKTIFSSVTGVFEPGKFTAIMGSSGAGKTTLLNAVAGETAGGSLSGAVHFNGATVDTATIRRQQVISEFLFAQLIRSDQGSISLSKLMYLDKITSLLFAAKLFFLQGKAMRCGDKLAMPCRPDGFIITFPSFPSLVIQPSNKELGKLTCSYKNLAVRSRDRKEVPDNLHWHRHHMQK